MEIYNKPSPNASFSIYICFIIIKDLGDLSDHEEDNNFKDLCEFSGFDSSFVKRKIKKKLESFSICEERLEHMRNSIKN